jgi:hypothetical protein
MLLALKTYFDVEDHGFVRDIFAAQLHESSSLILFA